MRRYKEKNPEKVKEMLHKYYETHKEQYKEQCLKFRTENKKKWAEYVKKSRRKKVGRLLAEGCTNPWSVINGKEPKYRKSDKE